MPNKYLGVIGSIQKIILDAFDELDANPKKYAKKFKVIIPKKTWRAQTIKGLKEFSEKNGSHMTDWVEMALAWAQALVDGDYTWKYLSLKPNLREWYWLFVRKNGHVGRVAGDVRDDNDLYQSIIDNHFI